MSDVLSSLSNSHPMELKFLSDQPLVVVGEYSNHQEEAKAIGEAMTARSSAERKQAFKELNRTQR
jgi:hypothetical protein